MIHQAYFLPWLGYLSRLVFADAFVVLDDVAFRKRHFQDRTRIIDMHGRKAWIGIPVGDHGPRRACDVIIQSVDFLPRLLKTIRYSYTKAAHFSSEYPAVENMLRSCITPGQSLVGANVSLLRCLLIHIGLPFPHIHFASAFSMRSEPTERIIDLMAACKGTQLVLGGGKSWEVHDTARMRGAGIVLFKHDFAACHPEYRQVRRRRASFAPGLSTIDALLNVGRGCVREYITAERVEPVAVEE